MNNNATDNINKVFCKDKLTFDELLKKLEGRFSKVKSNSFSKGNLNYKYNKSSIIFII